MLFFGLSLFSEERFLKFYFSRLTVNKTGRYADEFPYVSPCGVEMNFLRCDDRPFVFTALDINEEFWLVGNCAKKVPFEVVSVNLEHVQVLKANVPLYFLAPFPNFLPFLSTFT